MVAFLRPESSVSKYFLDWMNPSSTWKLKFQGTARWAASNRFLMASLRSAISVSSFQDSEMTSPSWPVREMVLDPVAEWATLEMVNILIEISGEPGLWRSSQPLGVTQPEQATVSTSKVPMGSVPSWPHSFLASSHSCVTGTPAPGRKRAGCSVSKRLSQPSRKIGQSFAFLALACSLISRPLAALVDSAAAAASFSSRQRRKMASQGWATR